MIFEIFAEIAGNDHTKQGRCGGTQNPKNRKIAKSQLKSTQSII